MKKLKTLIWFLCTGCVLPAQPPSGTIFEQGTLDEALAKAAGNRKDPRLVFPDCYTAGCGTYRNRTEEIFPAIKANIFHPRFLASCPANSRNILVHAALAIKDKINSAILSSYCSSMAASSEKWRTTTPDKPEFINPGIK